MNWHMLGLSTMYGMKRQLIILILLGIFSVQSYMSLSKKSATFDEVQYFGIGKYLLMHQKWDIMGAILHPPLSYYVSSLPLLLVQEDKRFWEYGETNRNLEFLGSIDLLRGQGFLSSQENTADRLLISSRCMILLLSLLLGYYVYRFSSELYGVHGGLLSLLLFTFCPNMLAYSGITVPDMPLTVFTLIALFYFRKFLLEQTGHSALWAGITLGLALLTKFTALLLLPVELLLYVAYLLRSKKKISVHVLTIAGLASFVLMAGYCFDITPYLQGNEHRLQQMKAGQAAFFHGDYSDSGWWYFYPAVFLLKTPIPVLTLFSMATVLHARRGNNSPLDKLVLYLPMVLLFTVCCVSNFSVGVRYILPIYPLLYVSIGSLASATGNMKIFMIVLVLWLAGSSLNSAPHYLSYFNEFIGGPSNGYKYLADSNLDWGQDLKLLKEYLDHRGIKRISLSYFGADSPQRYGIDYDWLPSHHLSNPEPANPVNILANQYVAISATNLQGVYFENHDEFKWFRQHEPVAKVGNSIFVYDLSQLQQYLLQ